MVRKWYLPEAQYREALRILEEHEYAMQRGYQADAEAAKSALQRLGAPTVADGDRIELVLKPRIMVTTTSAREN